MFFLWYTLVCFNFPLCKVQHDTPYPQPQFLFYLFYTFQTDGEELKAEGTEGYVSIVEKPDIVMCKSPIVCFQCGTEYMKDGGGGGGGGGGRGGDRGGGRDVFERSSGDDFPLCRSCQRNKRIM